MHDVPGRLRGGSLGVALVSADTDAYRASPALEHSPLKCSTACASTAPARHMTSCRASATKVAQPEKALRKLLEAGRIIIVGTRPRMGRPRIYGLPEEEADA